MALPEPQLVMLPIVSVDQKASPLTRGGGSLARAINVSLDKNGSAVRLDKRLGYQRVDCQQIVGTFDADDVWTHCAVTPADELLLFGYSYVAGCASPDALLRGEDALVQRGPSNRGQIRASRVSQSRISQEVADDS